jgi:hypothetical protein
MTDPPRRRFADLPPRPSRRQGDNPGEPPRVRQRRLVRFIAADPDLLAWLGDSKARTLHRVAADLTAAGHAEAAEMVRAYADRLTVGDVGPLS